MYKDVISYKLAKNVSQEHLLNIADKVAKNWMSNQPGFVKWEINSENDDKYIDIVYWASKEDAKKAEADMMNAPDIKEWLACYEKDSISSKKITEIKILS